MTRFRKIHKTRSRKYKGGAELANPILKQAEIDAFVNKIITIDDAQALLNAATKRVGILATTNVNDTVNDTVNSAKNVASDALKSATDVASDALKSATSTASNLFSGATDFLKNNVKSIGLTQNGGRRRKRRRTMRR